MNEWLNHVPIGFLSLSLAFWIAGAFADTPKVPMVFSKKPSFEAHLVDAAKNAEQKGASIQVEVQGVKLVNPESMNGKPAKGQAHLHYQVDRGPLIEATSTEMTFHELSPGEHTIRITLAGNDHTPIGPSQKLNINIPG